MFRYVFIMLLALAGPAHLAAAETITVCAKGCDYTSINAAIVAASDGDVIQLAAETYFEGDVIDTLGKAITLRGVQGVDGEPVTALDGQHLHRILSCFAETCGAVTLENLILQSGQTPLDEAGAGVILPCSLTATNCIFRENTAGAHAAVGVYDGDGLFNRCRFENNYSLYQGGAVSIIRNTSATGVFVDCTFTNNFAQGAESKSNYIQGGGAIFSFRAPVTLITCHFMGNRVGAPTFNGPDGYGAPLGGSFTLLSCTFDSCCTLTPPGAVMIEGAMVYDSWCDDCRGNVDCRNNAVDAEDLGYLLARWGTDDPQSDIDGDGVVRAADLGLLFAAWGPCQ